jgi:hypothetical protein
MDPETIPLEAKSNSDVSETNDVTTCVTSEANGVTSFIQNSDGKMMDDTSVAVAAGEDGNKATDSPKVQFETGTKEQDGSIKGVKRLKKKTFKDVVLKDVMESQDLQQGRQSGGGTPTKSILKVRSEASLNDSDGKVSHLI